MRKIPIPLMIILQLVAATTARSQVTVRIDAPTMAFSKALQHYTPYPARVTLTVVNPDTVATKPISIRIDVIQPMTLDTSEHGATIKAATPVAAGPKDSAKVSWFLVHPASLEDRIQRVTFWVKFGSGDSTMHVKNIFIPAAGPPVLSTSAYPLQNLVVLPDSTGYSGNPFEVRFRLVNAGDTPADSLKLHLRLPPNFSLDPPSQQNPIVLASLVPVPPGDPRFEVLWTVRYEMATRQPVTDTLRVDIAGKDIAGGVVDGYLLFPFSADGISPMFVMSMSAPDSLRYDTATVYSPQPLPVTVRVENKGRQTAVFQGVTLSIDGFGAHAVQPRTRRVDTLRPNEQTDILWDISVDRDQAPRALRFLVELSDVDGWLRSAERTVQVPGRPFSLSIVGLSIPDSLQLNAARSDFLSNSFELRYAILNDFWAGTTVTQTSVDYLGTGIAPPAPLESSVSELLPSGGVSFERVHRFTVTGEPFARTVPFRVMAVSSAGDTARAEATLQVPGIRPTMVVTRSGVDSLRYHPVAIYTPNPFEQRFHVVNTTTYTVRLDSIALAWSADSVSIDSPTSIALGISLRPGDTLRFPWVFRAIPQPVPRNLSMRFTAYFAGQFESTLPAGVFIPAIAPNLVPSLIGERELQFDAVYTYKPNPFLRNLTVRNTGTAPIRVDSAVLDYRDSLVTTINPRRVDFNLNLVPGDSVLAGWTFTAVKRDTTRDIPMVVTLYHSGGSPLPIPADVRIPGRPTGLRIIDVGVPTTMLVRPDGKDYLINPIATSFRVFNDSWIRVLLVHTRMNVDDPSLSPWTPVVQNPSSFIYPGNASEARVDSFYVWPAFVDRRVMFTMIARDSYGNADTLTAAMFIPALPTTRMTGGDTPRGFAIESVHPNPASHASFVYVAYTTDDMTPVELEVVTVLGEVIERRVAAPLNGSGFLRFESPASSGMYLVRLKHGPEIRLRRFVVLAGE